MENLLVSKNSKSFLRLITIFIFLGILSFSPCARVGTKVDQVATQKEELDSFKSDNFDETLPEVYIRPERTPAGKYTKEDYDRFDYDSFGSGNPSFGESERGSGSFQKYRNESRFGRSMNGKRVRSSIDGYHNYEISSSGDDYEDACLKKSGYGFDYAGLNSTIATAGLAATLILGTYYNYDLGKRSIDSRDAFLGGALSKSHGDLNLPGGFFSTPSANPFLGHILGGAHLNANLAIGMGAGNMGLGVSAGLGGRFGGGQPMMMPPVNGRVMPFMPQGQMQPGVIQGQGGAQYQCSPIQMRN